jgi:hypothetical protein
MAGPAASAVEAASSIKYDDKPLKPNECRLLKHHENTSGDIVVSLSCCKLDFETKDSPYYALSYTWGHPYGESEDGNELTSIGKLPTIICDGVRVGITRNAFEALLELTRRRDFVYLWVDAICIIQKDDKEKTEQIRLMGDIYTKAKEVIIWLGCGDEESKEVIPLIQKFGPELASENPSHIAFNNANYLKSRGLYPLREGQWRSILVFFRRGWFRRVWTLQEAALAYNIRTICGSEEFDLNSALIFASFLHKSGWDQDLHEMGEHLPFGSVNGFAQAGSVLEWIGCNWPGGGLGKFRPITTSSGEWLNPTPDEVWLNMIDRLVRRTRNRESTKPEDKLLAPLSLAVRFMLGVKQEMKRDLLRMMECGSTPQ